MYHLASILLLAGLSSPGESPTAGARPATALPTNQVTLLEGKVVLLQEQDGEILDESSYEASLLTVTDGRAEEEGQMRVLMVRTLTSDDEQMVSLDRIVLNPDLSVLRIEERDQETDDVYSEVDFYFPRQVLPGFPVPEAGKTARGKTEVILLNQYFAEGPFTSSSAVEEGKLRIRRALDDGAQPKFEFLFQGEGYPSRLLAYRETYVLDPETRVLEGIERQAKIAIKLGEDEIQLTNSLELKLSESWHGDPEKAHKLAEVRKALAVIHRSFRAREKSTGQIDEKIAAFEKSTEGTPLEKLNLAVRLHRKGYADHYESETEFGVGPTFVKILGKKVPDFTVEDLDGKSAKLSELSKGKVTLLSFWGLG